MIAYTIGNTVSYDQALNTDPDSRKIGKNENYQGGIVFKTAKDALDYLWSEDFLKIDWGDNIPRPPEIFSIYKILLHNNWDLDTYSINNKNYLLIDCAILSKV
jgi:hypothetical protein